MTSNRPGLNNQQNADTTQDLDGLKIGRPASSTSKTANPVQARFEKILEQELSGTTFQYGIERKASPAIPEQTAINNRLAQKTTIATSQSQKPNLKPLSRAKILTSTPFEGKTILDKAVSFTSHILKLIRNFIISLVRRLLFKNKIETIVKKSTLETNQTTDKRKKKPIQGRSGPSVG